MTTSTTKGMKRTWFVEKWYWGFPPQMSWTWRYRYTSEGGVWPALSEVYRLDGTRWRKVDLPGFEDPEFVEPKSQVTEPGTYALQFEERDGDVHQVMFEITASGNVRTKDLSIPDETEGWIFVKRMPWGAKGNWGHRRCLVGVDGNSDEGDNQDETHTASA